MLRMTATERVLLANFTSLAVEKVITDINSTVSRISKSVVPTSSNDFRKYMEGKGSILNNVPIPLIHQLPNGDAYALPSDFLRL